jgi:tripartite-type tricarboxylate transporter receptor subunit TctC
MLKRLLATALGVLLSCAPALAADNTMFRGKTITYIIATGPGGGYDSYGRLIVRYLQKYLPGSRILVKNVPGAGHIVGANTIYAARPDGLTFGTFNTGLIYDQLLQRPGVKFDLTKFSYLGKASEDTRAVVISTKSGVKSFDEIMKSKTPVKFAASGIGSAAYIETRILQNALHVPLQIVPGFDGNEGEMSMLRNEVVAQVGTANSLEPFVKNRNGFFALAITDSDTLPGVPKAMIYAKDDRAKRLLTLISTLSEIGRLTAGPPGIPPATLAVLREALAKAMADPAYIADAKRLGLPLDPAPGDKVEAMVKQQLVQSPELIADLKRAASE